LKIDVEAGMGAPEEAADLAARAESYGFDCFWVNETKHDPFVQLALAARSTKRINLGTSIALAFTRSPTTLAYTAWDLQGVSKGRLLLGLGSQVKGHIERRFGMKWEPPVPKMRETVLALRAVWSSWQTETKLDFRGRFYRLNLMTPFFNPGPIEHPSIPVYLAAVNAGMCRAAGSVAEGVHVHPLHTVRYLREVIRPAVVAGAARAGRKKEDVALAASVFAAVGETEQEVKNVREAFREQIAFYASTRSYRKVLELHGWGDVCERLHALSVRGDWGRMASEISDEMLHEIVVDGTWDEVGRAIRGRYGALVDRVRLYLPFDGDPKWKRLAEGFEGGR
jgi:probable F420-dependent oxidoreductase